MAHESFSDELITRCRALGNSICVGFDPRPELLPAPLRLDASRSARHLARAYARFAELMIDACHDLAPILKPQLAFFESLGSRGMLAYEHCVAHARRAGMLVLADAKRGDIGTTAAAYAEAFFGTLAQSRGVVADAITLNPYLGFDSVKPFMDFVLRDGRGLFVLVRTSNPSSKEIQSVRMKDDRRQYELVADLVDSWGVASIGKYGYSSVGMVVGATHEEDLRNIRASHPKSLLLVPGYGAQGGNADSVRPAFDASGIGALISSSREIMGAATTPQGTLESAFQGIRAAVSRMKDDLARSILGKT